MFRSREQNMSSHNQNFEVQDSQTKKKEVQEYDGEPSSCVWEGVEKNRNSTADKTPKEV
jgi:hypothetical protein